MKTKEKTKEELVATLAEARENFDWEIAAFRRSINPLEHIERSFRENRSKWIVGSVVAGFLGTRLFRYSRRQQARREGKPAEAAAGFGILTLLGFALKTVLAVTRPAAAKLLEKRVVQMLE